MGWLYFLWTQPAVQVGVGGALGANVRYWLGRYLTAVTRETGFPIATCFINVTGSFVLGLAVALVLKRLPTEQHHWFLLSGTGFCGGYTTFSTFSLEVYEMSKEGRTGLALLYAGISVLASWGAVALGLCLADWLRPPGA